jgi:hypothetical protein
MEDDDSDIMDRNIEHCLLSCLKIEKSNIYNEYPTFRLPYFETPPIHNELKWFNDGLIYYKGICKLIEGEINYLSTKNSDRNIVSSSPMRNLDVMATSLNVKELAAKIKPISNIPPIVNKNNNSKKIHVTPKLGISPVSPVQRKSITSKSTGLKNNRDVKSSPNAAVIKLEHPQKISPEILNKNNKSEPDENVKLQRSVSADFRTRSNTTMLNKIRKKLFLN